MGGLEIQVLRIFGEEPGKQKTRSCRAQELSRGGAQGNGGGNGRWTETYDWRLGETGIARRGVGSRCRCEVSPERRVAIKRDRQLRHKASVRSRTQGCTLLRPLRSVGRSVRRALAADGCAERIETGATVKRPRAGLRAKRPPMAWNWIEARRAPASAGDSSLRSFVNGFAFVPKPLVLVSIVRA